MITLDLIASVLEQAKKQGADHAKITAWSGVSHEVEVRKGDIKTMSSARGEQMAISLLKDSRRATVETCDMHPDMLRLAVVKAWDQLAFVDQDSARNLADPDECTGEIMDLALFDPEVGELTPKDHLRVAKEIENAAFAADHRVRNTRASKSSSSVSTVYYGSTAGILRKYEKSLVTLSIEIIADSEESMQAGGWSVAGRNATAMLKAQEVGCTAAQRAVRQLGGRKVKTQQAPIVFDPETAAGMISYLAEAVSGGLLYQGQSYLCDMIGNTVASPLFTLVDDATIVGGICSRPFDGDGVISRRVTVVDAGTLTSYLLSAFSARKLGQKTTGHAGGISNLYLCPDLKLLPAEIIRSVADGLYVTEMMGFGVNLLTGEFSKGARGLWIKDGELTYPVEEITIAGNLRDIYRNVEAVGNDLTFRSRINAPTIKISSMVIAGN